MAILKSGGFSPEFTEALEAKGINAIEFVRQINKTIEDEFIKSGNQNTFDNLTGSYVLTVSVDLRYAPVVESKLAEITGIARSTLINWRAERLLDGLYRRVGQSHYYSFYPTLRRIRHLMKERGFAEDKFNTAVFKQLGLTDS